jgi:dienelactone hydrolase
VSRTTAVAQGFHANNGRSFDGEVVDPDAMSDPEKAKKFDVMAFIGRHNKEIRWPEIKNCAQELKKQYSKVAAIGFCYGGWACFKLAADPPPTRPC